MSAYDGIGFGPASPHDPGLRPGGAPRPAGFPAGGQASEVPVAELTPLEVRTRLDAGDDIDFVDVREPNELEKARIEGARLVPLSSFEAAIPSFDWGRDVVLFCKVGARSARAARRLQAAGFTRVWSMAGGILRWSAEVDPSVPRY
jgi:adenylyltransferase/sulfurtransferase